MEIQQVEMGIHNCFSIKLVILCWMKSMSCTFCLFVDKLAIVRIYDQMPVVSTVEFSCFSFKTTEEITLN